MSLLHKTFGSALNHHDLLNQHSCLIFHLDVSSFIKKYYVTLTILWSSDSRGLQARSRNGEWIDVIAPPDQFIINIGDLMMNWTNDKWVSTLHRVVPHPETKGQRRMSIPFFHNPNPDAIVECIASCQDEANPPKYKPMLAKTHLEMKVSKALGSDEKMSD